jgi:ABC-type amino acid transport substrate-binding protein
MAVLLAWGTLFLDADEADMTTIFPTLKGWTQKGKPDVYTPDNLFEYINGAAEVFLSYDLQALATITYENRKKNSFTVDVYRHNNNRNGFGIYSAEKPQDGNFIPIGAQGYYEKGILNFLKGTYYVKMSGYDLGDNDKQVLTTAAAAIAETLKGTVGVPTAAKCFPGKGKQANSERYINRNFLGHSFLHSAFTADYEINGRKFQVFIIESENAGDVEKILQSYLDFLKKKGLNVEENKNLYRFQDPYYRSYGTMNLKKSKNYLWGLFSKGNSAAEFFIREIEKNLKKNKLI